MKKESTGKSVWLQVTFRVFAVVFAAGGLFILQGISEALEPWMHGVMASSPLADELRFHGAVHGALIGILFSFSLLAMLKKPLSKPILLQYYIGGHLIFLATLAIMVPALAFHFILIVFGVVLAILYATYAKRREIFRPSEPAVMNRTLLIMAGIALLGLLPFSIDGAIHQLKDPVQQFRWGEGTALSLVLLYGGYLTATGRTGSRTLGAILSMAYVFLGAASITIPGYPGSWGLWGGLAAILYGCVYAAILFRQSSARNVTAPIESLSAKSNP
ncbi:hypothetical protein [Paenibacillus sedimenti]|uniref:Uncharacterized protein n=1 Tax=Paenibacillus sedimenti TaxID=2770274 RepID=A0A926KTX0_9BACL|nr:hypothetical protein [Paenibacillus sedimenti]MBD0383955.1 hypothetical protein [Paenibacillus sedimenti]